MPVLSITPTTLQSWINENKPVQLIDVREADEFQDAAIEGSASYPLSSFSSKALTSKEGEELIFICLAGKRSAIAAFQYLSVFPNKTVYNLEGGLIAWDKASLPLCHA